MATLKKGDDVKTIIELKNGMFTPDVKKGATGTVLETVSSKKVKVHFPSAGFLWPEVNCEVDTDYLVKI